MKARLYIWVLPLLLALAACDTTTREARRMVKRAELLADTLPDSTVRLIDSVLRMPASFSERERMDMALLQAEALFGDHGQDISPVMDDDFFDDHNNISTSPELERAAAYYAKKKQYGKAAHAALYSGFVQQHYDEKEDAMRSFKEAEQYGKLVDDSLTVALAQYRIGKMLYDDYRSEEALALLKESGIHYGLSYGERAYVRNMEAIAYITLNQFDQAEKSLEKSLNYAEQAQTAKVKLKVLNNYAVLRRLEGKYDEAIAYLKQIKEFPSLSGSEKALLYLNLGKVFLAQNKSDSAAYYYHQLEEILPTDQVKDETKASSYGTLSRLAEIQGDTALAFQYLKRLEEPMSVIQATIEKQTVFRIQQQYDYESLQNEMNRKLIQRQRIIAIVSVLAFIGLAVFAVSQIRLARMRKQEAEAKANLFHFMQKNKELVQKQESNEKALSNLTEKHEASKKAYQDLMRKNIEMEALCNAYAQQYSNALDKNALIIRKLGIYLENTGEAAYLVDLKEASFGKNTPWDALMDVFDILYPDVRKNLKLQHPELTEMEQKDFILSFFNISRDEEAVMFKKTVHTVDKIRNSVRRKMQNR
jgi:tetratricopeptide (TPR) repeat protein